MQTVTFQDLGEIDYKQAWDLQESLLAETVRQKVENRTLESTQHFPPRHYLLFCEHPHVFTLGKSGAEEHLLADEQKLEEIGATYYKINRGGDITYHGPGQLVGYPIFDLDHFFNDIHKYLRFLEESIILTLAEYGIVAGRVKGLTGVWLDGDDITKARKICAFGVRCSRWVTMHGFAFNINNDLSYFNKIVPCGISDRGVTSLSKELGREVDINEVKAKVLFHMKSLFLFEVVN
ncbi:MAG: lipoyl(octanoyl) transferase LipB [Bacteroidetes bacterium]|nr:lipoyl(octanoyl) transferase LipB [Bacteroidota bacterium]